jgi:PAS domain S-box-containing protein
VTELVDALLESVADAIYLVGADGRVRFVNPAGVAVLGYEDADQLVGRDSHSTIHHSRPDGTPFPSEDCPLLNARHAGRPIRVDHDWFVRRDGSMVPVGYASAPFATDDGNGAVVVFRDITAQLEAEEAHARAAAQQARAEEIAASRARIVAAAAEERRRIGRDLHDGAQQRMLNALLRVEDARRATPSDALDVAAEELRRAIRDLRALAAGIHPAVLTDHGLAAAIEDLTAESPLPVSLQLAEGRWSPDIEAAAYFVVAEALANVVKHSGATAASVRVVAARSVVVEVYDNGRGGADPGRGTGLRGLSDRVAALGGLLEVESSASGTLVRAALPQ